MSEYICGSGICSHHCDALEASCNEMGGRVGERRKPAEIVRVVKHVKHQNCSTIQTLKLGRNISWKYNKVCRTKSSIALVTDKFATSNENIIVYSTDIPKGGWEQLYMCNNRKVRTCPHCDHLTLKTIIPNWIYFWMMNKYWDVIGWRWEASDQSFFSIRVTSWVISVTLITMGRGEESKGEREGKGEGVEGKKGE